ncbi:hypothetical protein [Massilia rubra]|uniref:Uncharacterized protein n=1 Tax=Massilia rubra TaxID=2607910 RepID=A0ABX0M1F1_9BURK|nr:hypothetical protein [Massilia rubra]NHZ38370.1 hypothetical protein [Massilia rubra]
MNELLEFAFDGVSPDCLGKMMMDFARATENVSTAVQDGLDLPLASVLDPAYWHSLTTAGCDSWCIINLKTIDIGDKAVDSATLLMFHNDELYNLAVLLSSKDCTKANLESAEEFYQWAKASGKKYCVADFYGGMDPASDEKTRLYSKGAAGPFLTCT